MAIRVLVALAIALAGAFSAAGCSSAKPAATPLTLVASAKPGVDHASLLALAGSLVGGTDKLADPAAGRLPDTAAFHAVGIATLTISGSSIRVAFLRSSSTDQRQTAEQKLRSSPLVATVTSH